MIAKFLLTAVLTFLSTEIDDFVVFVVLFSQAETPEDKKSQFAVMLGQIIALVFITSVCAFVAYYLLKIPQKYLRFIGILPIALGIKAFFDHDEEAKIPSSTSLFFTALLLTIVSSTDNLGVYIPVFTTYSTVQKIITIGLFAFFQVGWSFLQMNAARIPVVSRFIAKYSRWIIPVVFIGIGLIVIFT